MAPESSLIQIKELHPTFGAEIIGVDFSQPISDEVFSKIHDAMTKVFSIFYIPKLIC